MDSYILSGDKIVGKWVRGNFTLVDKNLAPMYLVNTGNVDSTFCSIKENLVY